MHVSRTEKELAFLPCHSLLYSFETGSLPEPGAPMRQLGEQPASPSDPSVSASIRLQADLAGYHHSCIASDLTPGLSLQLL